MLHHVIAKFTSEVTDKPALLAEVEKLFAGAVSVPGVHGVKVIPNCIDRPNRYDVMIVLDMDKESLPAWDACEVHHTWKEQYGHLLEKKAVFDCE